MCGYLPALMTLEYNESLKHSTVVCFAPKTDIPYIWVKMKV